MGVHRELPLPDTPGLPGLLAPSDSDLWRAEDGFLRHSVDLRHKVKSLQPIQGWPQLPGEFSGAKLSQEEKTSWATLKA